MPKTPSIKTKKIEFFKKNNTNRKDVPKNINFVSSFSIKVNRIYFDKEKKDNLKSTFPKNMKDIREKKW